MFSIFLPVLHCPKPAKGSMIHTQKALLLACLQAPGKTLWTLILEYLEQCPWTYPLVDSLQPTSSSPLRPRPSWPPSPAQPSICLSTTCTAPRTVRRFWTAATRTFTQRCSQRARSATLPRSWSLCTWRAGKTTSSAASLRSYVAAPLSLKEEVGAILIVPTSSCRDGMSCVESCIVKQHRTCSLALAGGASAASGQGNAARRACAAPPARALHP